MSDVKRLLDRHGDGTWNTVPRGLVADYEAAVDACQRVIDLIDSGSISFEDDDLVRGASLVALARTALRRLRESVPA